MRNYSGGRQRRRVAQTGRRWRLDWSRANWALLLNRQVLVTGAALALGLLLWSLVALTNPRLVPSIAAVWGTAEFDFKNGTLLQDVGASMYRVTVGFVLGGAAGVVVGVPMGWYRLFRELANPWVQFFRMIPPLALIPVVIIYIGVGQAAKIIVIVFAVFLTVVIAAFQGVLQVDPVLVKAARTLGADNRQLLRSVVLPSAVPYILVGLRLGLAAGWTTVVAAELIAANSGLGYLVEVSGSNFDITSGYLAIILIGICGIAMDTIIVRLSRLITPWEEKVGR